MFSHEEVSQRLQSFIDTEEKLGNLHHTSPEWALWEDEVYRYLHRSVDQQAATDFHDKMHPGVFFVPSDESDYMRTLRCAIIHLQVVKARVDRGEYDPAPKIQLIPVNTPASIFIAHSGESSALFRLTRFLEALGVEPVIAEWLPFKGRQVPDQARSAMDGCAAAIVFATAADTVGERKQPGRGALIETGILQQKFGEKVIYLVEERAELGPMADGFAHEAFTQDNLERAFHRIVVELKAHKII